MSTLRSWARSTSLPGHHPSRVRLPRHRAGSATFAAAYPFLGGPVMRTGSYLGVDALSGEAFCFDPWALYNTGALTNPNVVLAGSIGAGKSALAKSLALRGIAAGRQVYLPGDVKGEWAPLARALDGAVITLGPGMATRLNPLHPYSDQPGQTRAGSSLRLLETLCATLLRRSLTPAEHTALDAALDTAATRPGVLCVPAVIDALADPDPGAASEARVPAGELAAWGQAVRHGLRRLTRGDLGGMFDGPSTVAFDPDVPMLVLDLSRVGTEPDAVAVAVAAASGWLEQALANAIPGSPDGAEPTRTTRTGARGRWVIYDEAWRLLASEALLGRLQAQFKLSRAYGIANFIVLHRLSDLDATGATGSRSRALAGGLLADCSTRIVYRQEPDQVPVTRSALGLTSTEADLLPSLSRGTGLWKLPGSSHLIRHRLHPAEVALFDTDSAMRIGSDPQTLDKSQDYVRGTDSIARLSQAASSGRA